MSDVVERAKAALEGVTNGPWMVNTDGWAVISSGSDSVFHGYYDDDCEFCGHKQDQEAKVAISIEDAEFIAATRDLVPELVAEVERNERLIVEFRRRDESASGVIDRLRAELRQLQVKHEQDVIKACHR